MSLKPPLRTFLLTLTALSIPAAFAHAELESSTPDNGQTVNAAPAAVELVFSEGIEVSVSTFKVYPLPDDLAAAEADAVRQNDLEPLSDTNDDSDDDTGDDVGDSASDQAPDDHDDSGSDDSSSDDLSSDSSGHNDSDDHDALGDSGSELTAFVESVLGTEGDEAARVDTGVSSQGSEITLELTEDLAAGWYVAMWRALSSDGHPIEGYVTFNYEP